MIQNFRKPIQKQNPLFPAYWYWQKAIPDYLIQCLDHETKDLDYGKGSIISNPHNTPTDIRDTDVMMFEPIHWFSGVLFNIALASNVQAEWNFSILGPESLQLARYTSNQHYTWHTDSTLLSRDEVTRKLSVVCMLSDKNEYQGGVFELEDIGQIELQRGDIIVFPSFMKHRVTEVTAGVRKTAVIWVSGYRSW